MTETVAIVDYGSGNLRSAEKSLARAATEAALDCRIIVTADPEIVRRADRIILPGVGAFADCRDGLLAVDGMKEAIEEPVRRGGKPFLGICVGMHLLAVEGHEFGVHRGMGWIDGIIKPMQPSDPTLKIPHMGWNDVSLTDAGETHPVAGVITPGDHAYFVHSYHMELNDGEALLGTADHGGLVTAIVGKDNIIGTQFHPEKSQAVGLKFLTAFLEWRP
ncbi:MAG: imidazole glycerol phosphate synthase subunit HisH [Kordiimonadales bacterium]|nr:MAG: imidazole glycerol phosphate synthase subunit HisH [Kordiimonadales bacterium]